jgi:hypothetical protein
LRLTSREVGRKKEQQKILCEDEEYAGTPEKKGRQDAQDRQDLEKLKSRCSRSKGGIPY